MVRRTNKLHGIPNVKRILFQSSKKTYLTWAWCKSGTRAPASGTQDTPQSLKVGPLTLLRFKSGTFRPSFPPPTQCLKMGPQDALQSLKVGPPSGTLPFFNEFFFLQNILSFFRICLFFLLFQITNVISDLVSQAFSGKFICGLRGMTYARKSLNVRNRKSRKIPSFYYRIPDLIMLKVVKNKIA